MREVAADLRGAIEKAAAHFRALGETEAMRPRGEGAWVKK
jgi:hypothetical protein